MAGEFDIEVHKRRVEFDASLRLALQTEESLIWAFTEPHDVTSEYGRAFDEIGSFGPPDAIVGKLQALPIKPLAFSRRWLQTSKWHDERHWDDFDLTKTLTNPASSVIRNFTSAWARFKDTVAVNALLGPVRRGMDGPGNDPDTPFDATNQTIALNYVPAGSAVNSGLTRAKVAATKQKFMANRAGSRELHFAISSKEWMDLVNDDKFTDRQYTMVMGDQSNGIVGYMGFYWHMYEDLPVVTGSPSYRQCIAWTRDGIRTGVVKDMQVGLDRRLDMVGYPWQAHWWADIGAARADEKLVVQVQTLAS